MSDLGRYLRGRMEGGRKLLVPYVMGGLPDAGLFGDVVAQVAAVADAVEIGLPYSDPLMDGPVIAAAAERAIADGTGPLDVLELVGKIDIGAPAIAMTYYNPVHRVGHADFCARVAAAGIAGLIVPDLPLEEAAPLREASLEAGVAWIPLVAPTTPPARAAEIAASATGFVYAVSTLGVTGARASLSERAAAVVDRCRAGTDLPVLVGIGVSTPEQAREATATADGVVIGSAVVERIVEREPDEAVRFLSEVRRALDNS